MRGDSNVIFRIGPLSEDVRGALGVGRSIEPLDGSQLVDTDGAASVRDVVREARARARSGQRVLVVTDADLQVPECRQLFGYADRRRGVAVVSSARLELGTDRFQRRFRNVVAHELAHLDGLRHCTEDRCLMQPASELRLLDRRRSEPCGRCPHSYRLLRRVAAAAVLTGLLVVGTAFSSTVGGLIFGSDLAVPFSCRARDAAGAYGGAGEAVDDVAVFHFEGAPMFTIHDKAGNSSILDRSRPVMHHLNELWRHDETVVLSLSSDGRTVLANGAALITVLPSDRHGRPEREVAAAWIQEVASVFRDGGKLVAVTPETEDSATTRNQESG